MTIPVTRPADETATQDDFPYVDEPFVPTVSDFLLRLRAADLETRHAMLRDATPDEALAAVQTMTLRELYELPRDVVEGWEGSPDTPGTARFVRTERLCSQWNRKPIWLIADIARAANVRKDGVGRWRAAYNNQVRDWTKRLPAPDDSAGEIKQPGQKENPGGIPLWYPSTVLAWLKKTKRVTDDLYPHARRRGGRIPPGRPPKQREGD